MRGLLLRGVVGFGAAAVLMTEALSLFHLLRPGVLAAVWLMVAAGAAGWVWRRRRRLHPVWPGLPETLAALAIAPIAACAGAAAWLSPPNSADAMAYHLPRVVYWAQAGSVAFFPTPYFNQITLAPAAEYLMLHSYLISGGDRFINLLTFAAFLASVAAVWALAGELGLSRAGQAMAAVFCATLPNGILQASGAKNEWLLTLFLILAVYFAVRREAPWGGVALGLALATKATAYLFAPPLVLAALLWRGRGVRWLRTAAWLAAGVVLINTPQYVRNLRLSGSPLGYDSAQGDGFFRWRNEHPGWRSTVSNALRNASEQMGARSVRWNQGVYDAVLRAHRALGLDPQDPDTTWRWSRYEPPLNANHEANANNRWHLLLLAIAAAAAGFRRDRRWLLYAAALGSAWLLFCFYLKWQPFLGRLELPLFVLGAPLAGWLLEQFRPRCLAVAVCLFLLSGARLPAVENWTRPLAGPHSLLRTARDDNYFSDMGQWNNRESYRQAVEAAARAGCGLVGLDISENQLEYPFQALLRERRPGVRFVHTGVENASARYSPSPPPHPCVVLCPDCAGNGRKLALYQTLGTPQTIGRFLLWLQSGSANR